MPHSTPQITDDIVDDGQFDDAPEDGEPQTQPSAANPREGHRYIDEEEILQWSSEDEDEDAFDAEEDDLEAAAFQSLRPEDEDWEIAEGDFTKQYNRLKQHVAVRTGSAQGVASAINGQAAVATLPAVNRPRAAAKATKSTASTSQSQRDKTTDQLQALSKYSSRLRNIDLPYNLGVGVNRKGPSATANMKDKSDRATTEQVLDPRTRIILFKMIGRGLIFEVNGCVSTGKEANVYHALSPERRHLALKIYKTSILVFKDRDRYVTGEFRFRKGYSRHNPRKMVRVWAEKEMRNLKRLYSAGIRCPEPLEVRENVLVMSFVGDKDGWASPRLKDADIPAHMFTALYIELLTMTRKMFIDCKLVHADLSEYNILYHVEQTETPAATDAAAPPQDASQEDKPSHNSPPQGHLYIIDVSQSVEHDHPHAFDFLRADLNNIEEFFGRRGVPCVGLRRAFDFITRDHLVDEASGEDEEAVLRKWMEEPDQPVQPLDDAAASSGQETSAPGSSAHEDSVFMRSYIPRTLNEVVDPERDVGALNRGEGDSLIYKDMIAVAEPKVSRPVDGTRDRVGSGERAKVTFENSSESEEDSEDDGDGQGGSGSGEDDGDETGEHHTERQPRGHRHEDKEAKKERKKAVKAEAREKRKNKIPKAEKKRKIKATARSG